MGGRHQETINGLRIHESKGEVHLHDDSKGLKFYMDSDLFKEEAEGALKQLGKTDGIVEIDGESKNSLCIMKSGRVLSLFIKDSSSIKTKLQSFLRKL